MIFDITKTQAAIDSIKSRLRDGGYPRADVAAGYTVYDTVAHRARITLDVIPGVRARIGAIRVFDEPMPEAPRRLSDATVLRLLDVQCRATSTASTRSPTHSATSIRAICSGTSKCGSRPTAHRRRWTRS